MSNDHPAHRGDPVRVGPFFVLAGGYQDLCADDLDRADVLVALTPRIPDVAFGREYRVLAAPLEDLGGVPRGWEAFLTQKIIPRLAAGERLLAYCAASHGRTGTFLASLIALLESPEDTPDPIEAVRERHCQSAVETREQAEAIFAIRGERLPERYVEEFAWQEWRREPAIRPLRKGPVKKPR